MKASTHRVCVSLQGNCLPRKWSLPLSHCTSGCPSGHPHRTCSPQHPSSFRHASSSAPSAATEPAQHELVRWVVQQGGMVNSVELQTVDFGGLQRGWGLKASMDAAPGTKLIDLPKSCHLTYDGSSDEKLLRVIARVPAELWGAKLALQVLAHRVRGPSSPFSTYINYLPQAVRGVPIFFSKEAIDAFQYPPVSGQVTKRCRWLYQFSQEVLAPLPGTPEDPFAGVQVDINALGWGLAAVSSRAFRTRGPRAPAALLPLVDMANHDFHPCCEILPTSNGGMGLFTKQQVSAGQALTISYGPLTNDLLLLDYGFLVPASPHDDIKRAFSAGLLEAGATVAFAAAAEAPPLAPAPWKSEILEGLKLTGQGADPEVALGGSPPVDPRLLAAARVMLAGGPADLKGRKGAELGAWDKPLGLGVEVPALQVLMGVVAVTLSQFPTTLEEDLALLKPDPAAGARPLAGDVESAVRFRACKKQMLKQVLLDLTRRLVEVQSAPAPPPAVELRGTRGSRAERKGTRSAVKVGEQGAAKGFAK